MRRAASAEGRGSRTGRGGFCRSCARRGMRTDVIGRRFTGQGFGKLWITRAGRGDLLYRERMRIVVPHFAAAAVVVALALPALAGCESAPAPAPTTTTSTGAPLFASDKEALAAATEAYAAYLKASDDSWSGGSTTREDFLSLSTGEAHKDDVDANQLYEDRGWKPTGHATFDSMILQSSAMNSDGLWEIRTYLCLDVTETAVIDAAGASVAPPQRPLRLPLEVAFTTKSKQQQNLLISESRVWSGSNSC
jgi:hypothetical protein